MHQYGHFYLYAMMIEEIYRRGFNIETLQKVIKTIMIILFTFTAFIAMVELKSQLEIDIFPNIDTPFDEISAFILGR